jgi:hypothetical protein
MKGDLVTFLFAFRNKDVAKSSLAYFFPCHCRLIAESSSMISEKTNLNSCDCMALTIISHSLPFVHSGLWPSIDVWVGRLPHLAQTESEASHVVFS